MKSSRSRVRATVLGLLAVAVLGGAPAAASAASTLTVEAPSRVGVNDRFTVTASGEAESEGSLVLLYLRPADGPECAATAREQSSRGSQLENERAAPQGPYSFEYPQSAREFSPGTYVICGYLTRNRDEPPQARGASGRVTVVGDTDNDGKYDDEDRCPNEVGRDDRNGQLTADGCPVRDRDGDKVRDEEDRCPSQFGQTADGCPVRDDDRDGVRNEEDRCPSQFGQTADGCPPPPRTGNRSGRPGYAYSP